MKLFLAALLLTIGSTGVAWSQSSGKATDPQASAQVAPKTAEGEISRVDPDLQQVWLKMADGTEMQFSFTKDTPIEGASGTTEGLGDLSGNGTQAKIEYQDKGGVKSATKISIQSRKS